MSAHTRVWIEKNVWHVAAFIVALPPLSLPLRRQWQRRHCDRRPHTWECEVSRELRRGLTDRRSIQLLKNEKWDTQTISQGIKYAPNEKGWVRALLKHSLESLSFKFGAILFVILGVIYFCMGAVLSLCWNLKLTLLRQFQGCIFFAYSYQILRRIDEI